MCFERCTITIKTSLQLGRLLLERLKGDPIAVISATQMRCLLKRSPITLIPRLVIENGEKSAAELSMAFHTTALSNYASAGVPAPRSPMTHRIRSQPDRAVSS